jgi:glycosyltransferase involved in cell wall biosynthesis
MTTVVHVITALGSGGAERVLYLIASHNSSASGIRHKVVCLSDEGVYEIELRRAGVEVKCLHMQPGSAPIAAFFELVKLLRRWRPDVIMTWLYHADLMGTLAGRIAGVQRIVWNIRCSDMDFSQYSPMTRWVVTLLARLSTVPWAIATNSNAGKRAHEALGYKPKRWVYLPNGFDTDEWKPHPECRKETRHALGLSEADFVIGMVARVDPQKDHATFLEAAKILVRKRSNLRFVLVGQGTDELFFPTELRPFALALGERRDLPRIMRTLDLLVLSSYGEGFPNVIGEAMASGVPCVATDVGDVAFIVGKAGLVVPPQDPGALAFAIDNLVSRPPEDLHALSMLARRKIEDEFSIEGCLKRYAELFKEAARTKCPALDRATRL